MPSKALEVNIATSRVQVTVDPKYDVLMRVLEKYYGIRDTLRTFLEELCHPYKNWAFIVQEARSFCLNYFHVLKTHPEGPQAAEIYVDTFLQAMESSSQETVRVNAADDLLLFVQRILKEAGDELHRFIPVLNSVFEQMEKEPVDRFFLFVKGIYQLNRIAGAFLHAVPEGTDFAAMNRLMRRYFRMSFDYWLAFEDPLTEFEKASGVEIRHDDLVEVFSQISHDRLQKDLARLEEICQDSTLSGRETLAHLVNLPGYGYIVSVYNRIPQKIRGLLGDNGNGNRLKLIFLLQVMNIEGLSAIHEEALRDINRTLAWLIQNEEIRVIHESLEKTFAMLRASSGKFPATALNCVLNVGRGVYQTDESDLVDYFVNSIVSLGFQTADVQGVGNDWQVSINPNHIRNIRVWLELIELNPKWSKKLLSSLLINLALTGVFIKDTDLFPRDITQLLNSDLVQVYNLVKQLARLFPCYFNDIGAEGRLRDISTQIDEICQRKDVLIHFLRKQSHVESSNQIVRLMEETLNFWRTCDKEGVKPFVPPDLFDRIETGGPYVEGVHSLLAGLFDSAGVVGSVTDLLNVKDDALKAAKRASPLVSDQDFERVRLAIELYRLLVQKYELSFTMMDGYLMQISASGLPDMDKLKKTLKTTDPKRKLRNLLSYLDELKRLILSSERYEIREDIYRKRHFTVDIPSMYGSYHEVKFDALGLTFRLESLVNVLFEKIVESFNLSVITRATISEILDCLKLFYLALRLDGVYSTEMERQLDLLAHALEIRTFSATQYLDIFRGFSQALSNIVNDYFNNMHEENLAKILSMTPEARLLRKYFPGNQQEIPDNYVHRVTEIFLRDRIASSLGLQQLDLFLSRILSTLYRQLRELPGESIQLLLGIEPQKVITPLSPVKKSVADIIYLGSKGLNLVKIKKYGLPVPPGFIITTELFRTREIFEQYGPAKEYFRRQLANEIGRMEKATGKKLGDPRNPLVFSVRSGASISQPGMMNTFLDVGINEEIVQGMIDLTQSEWFSWDTFRRFLQSYGMAFGLARDEFDEVIAQYKTRTGIPLKRDFSGEQMKEVALQYRQLIQDHGIHIEDSPFEQVQIAITKVLHSWESSKAKTYRKIMGISDDWGTAVTVQGMVFGNYSQHSGSGVFFTHNPRWSGDMILLWGDFTCGNQGEDVVSGLVRTMPISKTQAEIESRPVADTLEVMFPDIYLAMRTWAKLLIYEKAWSPQEMEFTFEGPETKDLFFLQTRDMAIRERRKVYSFDLADEAGPKLLGHGIGVSGGALAGRIVFSLDAIRHWRKVEPHTALIIARADTVPDDIKEIFEADGLLTARGGSTSHAAIVAYRLGKTCVVGCANLVCNEKEGKCTFHDYTLRSGDWISIDGLEGSVYSGRLKIRELVSIQK